MKYRIPEIELEKYESLDIISASTIEDPTNPVETTQNTDPYEADKW